MGVNFFSHVHGQDAELIIFTSRDEDVYQSWVCTCR